MAGPRVTVLVDILEEHAEELQFLWSRRRRMLGSPRDTLRELLDLDERLEAHLQGLLVGGEQGLALLEPGLAGDDPVPAFCAGYALLRSRTQIAARRVLDVFLAAEAGRREGLREALFHGPVELILPQLRPLVRTAPLPTAVAVAEVLGFQNKLELKTEEMDRFLRHEHPALRRAGWRAARLTIPRSLDAYKRGLNDGDPAVRREARLAAAWGRQPWLLDHCRKAVSVARPDQGDVLLLLAVLGTPEDMPLFLPLGGALDYTPAWYRALGALGNPDGVELLLGGMQSEDPRLSLAAGAAFTRITGFDVASERRVTLPPEDGHEPDEFEKAFLDEVTLPDPELAGRYWAEVKDRYGQGTRWCRGFDLSREAPKEVLAQIDLESRWEACLRGKFEGAWTGRPADLEVFPQMRVERLSGH